jgi:hypothetical protein
MHSCKTSISNSSVGYWALGPREQLAARFNLRGHRDARSGINSGLFGVAFRGSRKTGRSKETLRLSCHSDVRVPRSLSKT